VTNNPPGLPPGELDISGTAAPKCPICDDIGYVTHNVPVEHPDFGKSFPCRCQMDKLQVQRQKRVRALSALEAFANKTFDTFNPVRPGLTDEQHGALMAAYELAVRYAEEPNGWLLLTGTYGSGKTHLAAAIANYRVSIFGEQVMLITAPDLLDHLRATYGPTSEVGYDELFDRIRNASLLVLDDLGAESPTPWAKEKLYQLLNHRYTRRLPTVITTNIDLELIDDRIRSRLTEQALTQSIPLDLPDHRGASAKVELNLTNLNRYAAMTFETFADRRGESLPEDDQRRFEDTINLARAYSEAPSGWLAFVGRPGTGKTHLAAAIAHRVKQRDQSVVFVSCSELTDYLRASFSSPATISYESRLSQVKMADFVTLDNLVIDKNTTPWARDRLYDVITYRFDFNLPTVITSYQDGDDMDGRLASRLANRARCTPTFWGIPPYSGGAPRRASGIVVNRPPRSTTRR